jgi:hypothetical protein
MSSIENKIIEQIKNRADVGLKKYNTDMDRVDLSLVDWLEHTKQELLDAVIYLQKTIDLLS